MSEPHPHYSAIYWPTALLLLLDEVRPFPRPLPEHPGSRMVDSERSCNPKEAPDPPPPGGSS